MSDKQFGIYEKSFALIINELKKVAEIEKAVIFGSRAMGNYKKASDIDIAIFGKDINFRVLAKLNYQLSEEIPIPYFVDIVHFESIDNKPLQNHIIEHGRIIYER